MSVVHALYDTEWRNQSETRMVNEKRRRLDGATIQVTIDDSVIRCQESTLVRHVRLLWMLLTTARTPDRNINCVKLCLPDDVTVADVSMCLERIERMDDPVSPVQLGCSSIAECLSMLVTMDFLMVDTPELYQRCIWSLFVLFGTGRGLVDIYNVVVGRRALNYVGRALCYQGLIELATHGIEEWEHADAFLEAVMCLGLELFDDVPLIANSGMKTYQFLMDRLDNPTYAKCFKHMLDRQIMPLPCREDMLYGLPRDPGFTELISTYAQVKARSATKPVRDVRFIPLREATQLAWIFGDLLVHVPGNRPQTVRVTYTLYEPGVTITVAIHYCVFNRYEPDHVSIETLHPLVLNAHNMFSDVSPVSSVHHPSTPSNALIPMLWLEFVYQEAAV